MHLPVDGHVSYFQFGAIMHKAPMFVCAQDFLCVHIILFVCIILFGLMPSGGIAGL